MAWRHWGVAGFCMLLSVNAHNSKEAASTTPEHVCLKGSKCRQKGTSSLGMVQKGTKARKSNTMEKIEQENEIQDDSGAASAEDKEMERSMQTLAFASASRGDEVDLLQPSSAKKGVGGSCQKVLDKCTISQKMPVVGNLITNTFKDCVTTFNQISGAGLIQKNSDKTDCAQLSQAVRVFWQTNENTDTAAHDFILLTGEAEEWLESMHSAFDGNPDKASCDSGLAYLAGAVDEASETVYQAGDSPDMQDKVAWKPGDVLLMMHKARQVCTCMETPGSVLQMSSDSATKSGVMAAFATSIAHLKTISGFYERSATAFDEFVGNFAWLPESMTKKLKQYNADRHAWAAKMAKSVVTFEKCQALIQTDASAGACIQNGLKEAAEAAELSVVDAEQMMEIVDSWSKYVPLCPAFVQFAKVLPEMYEGLHKSMKSASLMQLGDFNSVSMALGALNQATVSLALSKYD